MAHQHWHIDVSYLNIGGTFYYLCSILDQRSLNSYTIEISSILYFQRKITGAALISLKY
jgi:hypothetical protein